jgi:adenylate cyclase
MSYREFHYRWEYNLKSSPEQLWPFVADTNRFNRDTGVPSLDLDGGKKPPRGFRRRLRLSVFGVPVEWEEQPFEWVRPSRFGVTRRYLKGPMAELRVLVELSPRVEGGTKLIYQVWARPKTLLGYIAIPLQIGVISARRFEAAYKKYDELASAAESALSAQSRAEIKETGPTRLNLSREKLISQGVAAEIANRLVAFIEAGDELDLARIRPYALADSWGLTRRTVLEACFLATRAGLLDLQWDLICPLCRGPQQTTESLRDLNKDVHCEGCQIDFTANFDRYVEVTFRPNASIRKIEIGSFCIGSPQRTPHVIAQQFLTPREERTLALPLERGRYRIRALDLPGDQLVTVEDSGQHEARFSASRDGWPNEEIRLGPSASLNLENKTDAEQLIIVERMAWSDQAATAAEVTALQMFRDLFSREALRPGEQISVGTLTVLFTDLRGSTRLYRDIGDATAFGRVMNHFDVLKNAIAEEDGALVKTIGDAVMAVFREPASGLRAMLKAQQILAAPPDGSPPLELKAGMHTGPCIAVTLNDRLDYFGSTVNMAARLEGLSTGNDVVISQAVYHDHEVRELVDGSASELSATRFEIALKGFDEERFELWRVAPARTVKDRD